MLITVIRRLLLALALLLSAVVGYWVVSFVATFQLLGLPVRHDTLGWLGPTPRITGCVTDIGKVNSWECDDISVFQRHPWGCRWWLRLNGLQ